MFIPCAFFLCSWALTAICALMIDDSYWGHSGAPFVVLSCEELAVAADKSVLGDREKN